MSAYSTDYAAMGLHPTINAFESCVPRSTASLVSTAPRKRGPKSAAVNAAKKAKLLAFNPFNSHNFAPASAMQKVVKVASSRFATA
ncbi:MAG: hypothetical protein HHJ15_16675 [Rhodoferax sp.]|uniref:hypothetical protein n=1 Tax=Rhodoferax sp. TaxID=50421 RepID=UPI0017B01B1E|nr:hypothetical protein [Rhodoferax sp.]NMM21563.1 hypothetical protein [Rhodoferax sp.]